MLRASKITVVMRYNALVVSFGDVTHLRFNHARYIGHQSWRAGYGDKKFVIEITLDGGVITCDYDREDKWKAVLKGLDDTLDAPT
jgi:major membrane immunogen (membrane-anchored lipoprotein)